MASNNDKTINANVMDYMVMEIVNYVVNSSKNLPPDAVFYKLEKIGFDIGQRLVERRVQGRKRFQDHLEIIKFVCTEIWTDAFGKQIDKLQTNHRGIFALKDFNFQYLRYFPEDSKDNAQIYVALTSGIIRGALSLMGLQATVVPECIKDFPGCNFSVSINPQSTT